MVLLLKVRLVLAQSVDVGQYAGRCPMTVDWKAGVDQHGQLTALQLDVTLLVSDGVVTFIETCGNWRVILCTPGE